MIQLAGMSTKSFRGLMKPRAGLADLKRSVRRVPPPSIVGSGGGWTPQRSADG